MNTKEGNKIEVNQILIEGQHYILDNFALQDEMYEKVWQTFLKGIEELESCSCRQAISESGLSHLHLYFPAEKLLILEQYLVRHLRQELCYWLFRVAKEDIQLQHTFYIDRFVRFRIYYPFSIVSKAKKILNPSISFLDKVELAVASKNPSLLLNSFKEINKSNQKIDDNEARIKTNRFYKNLVSIARSHGAHIDSWFGHSFDGLNFWWAIDGVEENNTVILYPELFAHQLPLNPISMFLAPDVPLTKPTKVKIEPKQLLVFNSEMLHGTQVNISCKTRIALSMRLNPQRPKFGSKIPAAAYSQYWFASTDLEKKRFYNLRFFPSPENQGKPSFEYKKKYPVPLTPIIDLPENLLNNKELEVCSSATLAREKKIAVNIGKTKILLLKTDEGLCAVSRICPHLGVDVKDGHYEQNQIFCPGHGLSFSCSDGTSSCESFKLDRYEVLEVNNSIFIRLKHNNLKSKSIDSNKKNILVAGYPRTGNNWVNILFSLYFQAPGYQSYIDEKKLSDNKEVGWRYRDLHAQTFAFDGEQNIKSIIKTHEYKDNLYRQHPKLLTKLEYNASDYFAIVVREPKDVAVSYFYFTYFFQPLQENRWQTFLPIKSREWFYHRFHFDKFVLQVARQWNDFYLDWLKYNPHIIFYEKLLENPTREIEKFATKFDLPFYERHAKRAEELCQFLNISARESELYKYRDKISQNEKNNRTGKAGGWKEYFSSSLQEEFDRIAEEAMKRLGYK